MARALITVGVLLVVAGLVWPWLSKLPFGRLPGDIVIERGQSRFFFPWVSCLAVSALASLVLWLVRR